MALDLSTVSLAQADWKKLSIHPLHDILREEIVLYLEQALEITNDRAGP